MLNQLMQCSFFDKQIQKIFSKFLQIYQFLYPRRKMYGRNRRDPAHFRCIPLECTRRWKQYSSRNFLGFFPMISDRFPQESTGNSQEFIGKNFPPEYCFHFRCFPAGYSDFSAPFLQDPARYDGRNLRPGITVRSKIVN